MRLKVIAKCLIRQTFSVVNLKLNSYACEYTDLHVHSYAYGYKN